MSRGDVWVVLGLIGLAALWLAVARGARLRLAGTRLLGAFTERREAVGISLILIGSVSVIYNLLSFTYSPTLVPAASGLRLTYLPTYSKFTKVGTAVGGAMIIAGIFAYRAGRSRKPRSDQH